MRAIDMNSGWLYRHFEPNDEVRSRLEQLRSSTNADTVGNALTGADSGNSGQSGNTSKDAAPNSHLRQDVNSSPYETVWRAYEAQNSEPWQSVTIPHDAMLHEPRRSDAASAHNSGWFVGADYEYVKHFTPTQQWESQRYLLEFEGVYRNAQVWINGQHLATRPYGYTNFYVDITDHIRIDQDNELRVLAFNSDQPNSRWYSGAGIYRPVVLWTAPRKHIALNGVCVRTVSTNPARIAVQVKVEGCGHDNPNNLSVIQANSHGDDQSTSQDASHISSSSIEQAYQQDSCTSDSHSDVITIDIVDPTKIAQATFSDSDVQSANSACARLGVVACAQIAASANGTYETTIIIDDAHLWNPEDPYLYECHVRYGDDEYSTTFGVRSLIWGADGLLINGKRVILQGACVHHDNGVLGACAYPEAESRKIRLLKEQGYNAIRSAHNPCSKALLDACDRQGMLVMDEYIDHWYIHKTQYDYVDYFSQWWREDLKDMVMKDRNHPSVIMYSTGNEVSETAQSQGIELTRSLTNYLHLLDPTRPVTCGVNIFFNFLSKIGLGVYSNEKAKKEADAAKPGTAANAHQTSQMSADNATSACDRSGIAGNRNTALSDHTHDDGNTQHNLYNQYTQQTQHVDDTTHFESAHVIGHTVPINQQRSQPDQHSYCAISSENDHQCNTVGQLAGHRAYDDGIEIIDRTSAKRKPRYFEHWSDITSVHQLYETGTGGAGDIGVSGVAGVSGTPGAGVARDVSAAASAQQAVRKAKRNKAVGSEFFNNLATLVGSDFMKAGATLPWCDTYTRDAFAAMDIAGYNYAISRYRHDLKKYPSRLIVGSETFCCDAYQFRQLAKQYPRLIGDFVWAGIDYLGETGIGSWEYADYAELRQGFGWLAAGSGRLDLTGNALGEALYTRVALEYDNGPYLAVCPVNHTNDKHSPSVWKMSNAIDSWSWSGCEGKQARVHVYARADVVVVLLNGRQVGRKKLRNSCEAIMRVPYEPGELTAISYDDAGRVLGKCTLTSASEHTELRAIEEPLEPVSADVQPGQTAHLAHSPDAHGVVVDQGDQVRALTVNNAKPTGRIVFIRVQYTDENGIVKPLERGIVQATAHGCELLAFGSAAPYNRGSYTCGVTDTYYGQALAVVRIKSDGHGCDDTIRDADHPRDKQHGSTVCYIEVTDSIHTVRVDLSHHRD